MRLSQDDVGQGGRDKGLVFLLTFSRITSSTIAPRGIALDTRELVNGVER